MLVCFPQNRCHISFIQQTKWGCHSSRCFALSTCSLPKMSLRNLESNDSVIVEATTNRSGACWTVHLPILFTLVLSNCPPNHCRPSSSLIMRMSTVISIRKLRSSFVPFLEDLFATRHSKVFLILLCRCMWHMDPSLELEQLLWEKPNTPIPRLRRPSSAITFSLLSVSSYH